MTTVPLWHEVRGEGAPFVLVHGFTGNHRDWADVVEELAADRRVVTLDHRGHGESPKTGEGSYSFDQLTDDLVALLDDLGLDRVDLLGHSMGGIVAMRLALRDPERLRSLVLMDTGAQPSAAGPADWLQAGIDAVRADGLPALAERLLPLVADDQRSRMAWSFQHMDDAAFIELGQALFAYPSMLPQLATLTVPTTVIVGEDDTGLRGAADDLAATIPGAVFELIPDAAHSPQRENRTEWMRAVHAHLTRADATT